MGAFDSVSMATNVEFFGKAREVGKIFKTAWKVNIFSDAFTGRFGVFS